MPPKFGDLLASEKGASASPGLEGVAELAREAAVLGVWSPETEAAPAGLAGSTRAGLALREDSSLE